jgi:hypothetical protein
MVELLEERLPAGAFFNGFGLGALNTLPLGLGLPGNSAGRPASHSASGALSNGLGDSVLETTSVLRPLSTNGAPGASSDGSASKPAALDNAISTPSDNGSVFDGNGGAAGSGSTGQMPGPIHTPPTGVFPPAGGATTAAPNGTLSGAAHPSITTNMDNVLFQAVSAAAAGAGKSPPAGGGITPLSPPMPPPGPPNPPDITPSWSSWVPYPNTKLPPYAHYHGHRPPPAPGQHTVSHTQLNQMFGALGPNVSPGGRLSPRLSPLASNVGHIQDVSQFIGLAGSDEAEVSIAVNPTNPNNIVALSNATSGGGTVGPSGGLMISYTFDGGNTWHPHYIATGGDAFPNPACCDPSMAFDRFGNLWFSYIDFVPDADSAVVVLSTDGGVSYHVAADLLDATNLAIDQPKLAVGSNSIFIVWHDVATTNEPDGKIEYADAYISGLGSWEGFLGINQGPATPNLTFQNFGKVAIGPNAQVVYTFQDPASGLGPDSIWATVDSLGVRGRFATPVLVTTTNVGGFAPTSNQPNRTVDAESEPAFDRSGGAFNGRLYVVYTDRPTVSSNSTDIFVRHSDDNGATWSPRVRVTDDNTGQPKILPRIQVDQTTGDIAVSWIDARNDPNGVLSEEFIAFSHDGGNSFGQNFQVAPAPSNATIADFGFDFGDFTGLTFNNGVAWPAWPDNSTALASINLDAPNSMDIATAPVTDSLGTGGGGGGGRGFAEDRFEPNDTSNTAASMGTLTGSQDVANLTITIHSNGFPDVDWFTWTMGSGGTFKAVETTDQAGPLELHIFKLVNGSLTDLGDATGSSDLQTLSTSVSTGDVMYVEVKGENTSPGVFTTGAYHLDVSVG